MSTTDLTIDDQSIGLGERAVIGIPITTALHGSAVKLYVHVLRGQEPGPTLTLLNTMHGGEWLALNPFRQLHDSIDLSTLRGSIVMIPVANPPAFGQNTRNVPDEVDSPDVNRIFPGPLASTGDQLVAAIAGVLQQSSCLIDFHMGPLGSAFRDVLVGSDFDPEVSARSLELALAFGSPIVRTSPVMSGFPGPKSAIGYTGGIVGVPALGGEVGGAGFGPTWADTWDDLTLEGLRGVMVALDMVDGPAPTRPDRQLVYTTSHRVNPRFGGMLRPLVGVERLATEVSKGEALGEVISPYDGTVLEVLTAPVDGLLFYVARDAPIYPGGWAFGVAETSDSSYWITNDTEQP